MSLSSDAQWHLKKEFPLAMIAMIIGNLGIGIWYASKMESRIADLEKSNVSMSSDLKTLRDNQDGGKDRLIRVEDNIDAIRAIVTRMENRLDGDPNFGGMKPTRLAP